MLFMVWVVYHIPDEGGFDVASRLAAAHSFQEDHQIRPPIVPPSVRVAIILEPGFGIKGEAYLVLNLHSAVPAHFMKFVNAPLLSAAFDWLYIAGVPVQLVDDAPSMAPPRIGVLLHMDFIHPPIVFLVERFAELRFVGLGVAAIVAGWGLVRVRCTMGTAPVCTSSLAAWAASLALAKLCLLYTSPSPRDS